MLYLGREEIIEFEHIVLASGYSPDSEFCASVKKNVYGISGCKFYKIGDCSNEMGCFNAIHEAFKTASEL